MKVHQKIKSVWNKLTGKHSNSHCCGKNRSDRGDAELGAEEVIEKEVFPKKSAKCSGTDCKRPAAKKPASKRCRPTNDNYQMIDPNDGTCDTGKS